MKINSLIKNVAFNTLNQISALVVPLITAPYIARVFSPELIGSYSYALANCSYFVLFECLGFTLYGQIRAASVRNDKKQLSALFLEIMTLKTLLMIFSIICYTIIIIRGLNGLQKQIAIIMILNIFANGIDVTWFLNGLEEFKLTAVRSIFIRVINVVMIYLFIKTEVNILLYTMIMQLSTLLGTIVVIPYALKKIVLIDIHWHCIKRHIKSATVYFVPGLITTIFSSTDKTMLGVLTNSYEVGIYEQANKISQICMNAICAIGNVIMPRAAYLYHNEPNSIEANKLFYNSLKAVLVIALPISFGISAISSEFIPFFFGNGYEKSSVLLKILCFNVLFTALSNLYGQQCLIARQKQRKYNIAVSIAAITNISFNFVLIPMMQSVGAALTSVIASTVSLAMVMTASKDIITIKKLTSISFKFIVASIIMYLFVKASMNIMYGKIFGIMLHILSGAVIYFLSLLLLKDKFVSKYLFERFLKLRRRE